MTEEKHRELVTMPARESVGLEPVAWVYVNSFGSYYFDRTPYNSFAKPLYSAEQLAKVHHECSQAIKEMEAGCKQGWDICDAVAAAIGDDLDREEGSAWSILRLKERLAQVQHLIALLTELREYVDAPPDSNCSCHISPPCNDCVDNSHLRDVLDRIAKIEGTKP